MIEKKIKYPKTFDDQIKFILIVLKEKSRTRDEILDFLKNLSTQLGASLFLHDISEIKEFKKIDDALNYLSEEGIVKIDEKNVYSLTEIGLTEAERYTRGLYYFLKFLDSLSQPSLSPLFSLIIHLFLGSLKIFGYFLTSSVSLLSDGLDSALDGVSAIVVGISMRIKKEIYALYLLLVLMLLTGLGILIQGIDKILSGSHLEDEMFIILLAFISIIIVGSLYIYQRYSGYRNRNLTILAQSEDSKNHILNASLVFIAALSGIFGFYFIDGLVAIFIGIIILYGAYKLYGDIRKQESNQVVNFEKYKLGMWRRYDKMKSEMLTLLILNFLKDSNKNIDEIIDLFNKSFTPITIKISDEKFYSLNNTENEDTLRTRIKELIESGLLEENNLIYSITDKGKEILMNEISKQKHRIRPFGDRKTHFHK